MDDTKEFQDLKAASAQHMREDYELQRLATDVMVRADRHNYGFQWTWLGLPIIQIPQDIVVLQEIVWQTRPNVIIETGVARGGSLVFFASMLQLLGEGHVIGIDIDIREHNRAALESHFLSHRISLMQGSSIEPTLVGAVRAKLKPEDRVMVVLDSNHTHEHVLNELRAYGPVVTEGQYLVVADTIVENIPGQDHRIRPWQKGNNPMTALQAYLAETDRFEIDAEIDAKILMTSSPNGYLKCIKS